MKMWIVIHALNLSFSYIIFCGDAVSVCVCVCVFDENEEGIVVTTIFEKCIIRAIKPNEHSLNHNQSASMNEPIDFD